MPSLTGRSHRSRIGSEAEKRVDEVFEAQDGLLRYDIGRATDGGDSEYVLTSVWSGVDALRAMARDDWQRPHIPEVIAPILEASSIRHYDVLAPARAS